MTTREALVNLANNLEGCPYIWGGKHPWTGLDCSGFVTWCLRTMGELYGDDLDAQQLYDYFKGVELRAINSEVPWELIFYGASVTRISHVMVTTSAWGLIGATGGDHTTTTYELSRQRGAAVSKRSPTYRSDMVGMAHITFKDEVV